MKHNPAFLALATAAKQAVRECTVSEVKARLDHGERFHLVDVREDREFVTDHVTGARHIGRGVLERDIESLYPDLDADIVLYCGGGFRSALAAESMAKMGYRRVSSMDGGIRAWREAGFPITQGQGDRNQ